tara:strand:+ start:194 stop:463 length:270 start_codon:yes stop_codon:yes gene_type:complete
MSNKIEAELFHTLKNINDLTKANITQALLNAVSAGTLALDEYTVQSVSSLVNATIDQSTDVAHTQVLKTVSDNTTATRKKPTGRKPTKA